MRAAQLHQRRSAAFSAIEHQFLAQHLDALRLFRDPFGTADRMPVPAQHLTHRCARADPRQQLVFFCRQHRSPPVSSRTEGYTRAAVLSINRGSARPRTLRLVA